MFVNNGDLLLPIFELTLFPVYFPEWPPKFNQNILRPIFVCTILDKDQISDPSEVCDYFGPANVTYRLKTNFLQKPNIGALLASGDPGILFGLLCHLWINIQNDVTILLLQN